MPNHARLVFFETFSSIAWFLMDFCWMAQFTTPAHLLALPTLAAGAIAFWYAERTAANLLVTGAMNAWAFMNVFWMMHDLGTLKGGLVPAKVFGVAGLLCLVAALFIARSSREAVAKVLERFRRLRLKKL